jgi:hypothetical protein
MYENACKLMAKQSVALEVLSYHATAQNDCHPGKENINKPFNKIKITKNILICMALVLGLCFGYMFIHCVQN